MSVLLERPSGSAAPPPSGAFPRRAFRLDGWLVPLLVAIGNAAAFVAVRPNVGDLQAALARESAAASGVGLTYWFDWFGGGSAPGSYSLLTPLLSTVLGAPLVGALAAAAVAPLARRALAGTPHPAVGTWLAVGTAGWNLWAGRIPFAFGCAVALVALIGVRERRTALAVVAAVAAMCCSPVAGAFLAFGLLTVIVLERGYRRIGVLVSGACVLAYLVIAVLFGSPGPEGFAIGTGLLTAGTALAMLLARPAPGVRTMLSCAAVAAVVIAAVPNGMGSNWTRFVWICLPPVVVATARARPWLVALGLLPALAFGVNATVVDLVRSETPSASAAYYQPLIRRLATVPGLDDYRLEVVSDPVIHTAASALIGHVALAGGYETQEQNAVNAVLANPTLNATSYKVWLDNNAVGYVAFDRTTPNNSPEYRLVQNTPLPYLHRIDRGPKWVLYRVADPTPIVPPPLHVLRATQAQLRLRVPCACSTPLRLRYSKYLAVTSPAGSGATITDDGTGWSVLTTRRPGVYVLSGSLTRPLH